VKLFRLLDADQSGSLDRAEFAKGCEMINALADDGEKLFEMSDIDGFMDALDVNGDGAISFAEFSDGLLNHGSMAAHSGAEIGVRSPAKPATEPEGGGE
jgi:Ca2+-binding EF-hand superfamily protein